MSNEFLYKLKLLILVLRYVKYVVSTQNEQIAFFLTVKVKKFSEY